MLTDSPFINYFGTYVDTYCFTLFPVAGEWRHLNNPVEQKINLCRNNKPLIEWVYKYEKYATSHEVEQSIFCEFSTMSEAATE